MSYILRIWVPFYDMVFKIERESNLSDKPPLEDGLKRDMTYVQGWKIQMLAFGTLSFDLPHLSLPEFRVLFLPRDGHEAVGAAADHDRQVTIYH